MTRICIRLLFKEIPWENILTFSLIGDPWMHHTNLKEEDWKPFLVSVRYRKQRQTLKSLNGFSVQNYHRFPLLCKRARLSADDRKVKGEYSKAVLSLDQDWRIWLKKNSQIFISFSHQMWFRWLFLFSKKNKLQMREHVFKKEPLFQLSLLWIVAENESQTTIFLFNCEKMLFSGEKESSFD